jgi:hypothetical protein
VVKSVLVLVLDTLGNLSTLDACCQTNSPIIGLNTKRDNTVTGTSVHQ